MFIVTFRITQKQLAFILGRQQVYLYMEEDDCPDADDLLEIMANVHLNSNFLNLAREVLNIITFLCVFMNSWILWSLKYRKKSTRHI